MKPARVSRDRSKPWRAAAFLAACVVGLLSTATYARAQLVEGTIPPRWVWFPGAKPNAETPAETRQFRREFQIKEPNSKLVLDATADNAFVMYLDGKEVLRGDDWRATKNAELTLSAGSHVLAVEATNESPGPAGFLMRGSVLPLGQVVPIQTGPMWKVAAKAPSGDAWKKPGFDDTGWVPAADLGPLGTEPWTTVLFESDDASARFKVPKGFRVSMAAKPSVTGSAIAFTFNADGMPCVSVEQGPIVRLTDRDKDGVFEDRVVIAPDMKNCQGLTFIKGSLYCVGLGPRGVGIYKWNDPNLDGVYDEIERYTPTDAMGEHGPHAIMLGPDGALYFNSGNHSHIKAPIDPKSAANVAYEGELLPHYNDSRGHATGIMSPCGEIYRSTDDGRTWQRMVCGFRNNYDFGFNRDGEAFSFDSDMEWDLGMPWYRPVRVTHSTPGADHGSRNGSGAMPGYFFDTLPPALEVGRGSPTGVCFYQSYAFPLEYTDNFLICDWSQGKILAIESARAGASYSAKQKTLVTGQPLNCTDIDVGPDGAVYFTTGGRGTMGGLFRVTWTGKPQPAPPTQPWFQEVLAVAQPLAPFTQRSLEQIKERQRDSWDNTLTQIAAGESPVPGVFRARALLILAQVGPAPSDALLAKLVRDQSADVRAAAVLLLGDRKSEPARAAVIQALGDDDPFVKRRACEALVRSQGPIPIERVLPLLGDSDRFVRNSARVALEHADAKALREISPPAGSVRQALEWMLAIVRPAPIDDDTEGRLLKQQAEFLATANLSPVDRLDLYRLIGLTYHRGPARQNELEASETIAKTLLDRFARGPARKLPGDATGIALAREEARLLAFLGEPKAVNLILAAQSAAAADGDRPIQVHYAYCLRAIKEGWDFDSRRRFWAWIENASKWDGGFSYLGYLDYMTSDMLAGANQNELAMLLANGPLFPFPTRVLVRSLNLDEQPRAADTLVAIYNYARRPANAAAMNELKALILEKLGQSTKPEAHAALRGLAQADSERRDLAARALASHPVDADLPLLVAALDSRDLNTTNIVLKALRSLKAAPDGPVGPRNLIRLARRSGPTMKDDLNTLASAWFGKLETPPPAEFDGALAFWSDLYSKRFPNAPSLSEDSAANNYTFDALLRDVIQSGLYRKGSAERGKRIIEQAKCLDCHKFGDQGSGLGPDLTTVSSRFRPHEILESMLEPSKVISDQYRSVTIATTDGKVLNGMPAGGDAKTLVLLLADGTKMNLPKDTIDEQKESKVSVMPDGLVNNLTLQEIADLLALFDAQPKVPVETKPK